MLNIRPVKEFIDTIIEKSNLDRTHLYHHGAVHYMNGNDGTDFDYSCNGHACEFYVFWKNESGAIKVYVEENSMVAYVYPEENPFGGEYQKFEQQSPFDLLELCEYLQGSRDDRGIYDKAILTWELEYRGYIPQEDEEEEEW